MGRVQAADRCRKTMAVNFCSRGLRERVISTSRLLTNLREERGVSSAPVQERKIDLYISKECRKL